MQKPNKKWKKKIIFNTRNIEMYVHNDAVKWYKNEQKLCC